MRNRMNRRSILLAALCLAVLLLAGCSIRVHVNETEPSVEELLENQALTADTVAYNPDGEYTVTFRYEAGGFEKMDLSRAYVAYDVLTVQDQIDTIAGEDLESIPPLPADAQEEIDAVLGEGQLEKIAVVTVKTVDDQTLTVSFTDRDNPFHGKVYYFIIPNEGLSGSVQPE